MTVNVLGTEYVITRVDYKDDKTFEIDNISGYCLFHTKVIVIGNFSTFPMYANDDALTIKKMEKACLRHEILHAFFYESGLDSSSKNECGPWARNEEMVDWFALQGPKIYDAWKQADTL